MEQHDNVGRMRDALEMFNHGDLDAYREFFDDDVVWFVRGTHDMAGAYRGASTRCSTTSRGRARSRGGFSAGRADRHRRRRPTRRRSREVAAEAVTTGARSTLR